MLYLLLQLMGIWIRLILNPFQVLKSVKLGKTLITKSLRVQTIGNQIP